LLEVESLKISMVVWNEFRNDARVLKEAETLHAAGHLVTVHALHTPNVTAEKETLEGGISVVRMARSPLWRFRKKGQSGAVGDKQPAVQGPIGQMSTNRQILRIIARLWTHLGLIVLMLKSRPDIVHSHDVNTLPTAWIVSVLSRSQLVYDAHEISTDREGYASFRSFVAFVEKHLMPRAQATITTTDARAKFFRRAYQVSRPIVLQNRPRKSSSFTGHSNRLREELQLNALWPIIVYQGGLQQGRGLERLVEVAAKVDKAYIVFIGGGRLESLLKARAHELGLEDKVYFIPTVSLDDLPEYTASADIGVQPIENTCLNHFTTDSNKLFEYVTAGLPVVASDLPEIRAIVSQNQLGLLVKPGDSDELAAALNRMVSNPELREKYQKNSKIAREFLNWEEQEHKLIEFYDKVATNN